MFVHRKEGGDSESGELHVEVSRRDERHHAARRAQAGPGALDQAAHRQVGGGASQSGVDASHRFATRKIHERDWSKRFSV